MASLFCSKLGTEGIDHDPVKHGPTRGPRFDALLRTGRQIRTQSTVCFMNLYLMLHQWLGTASLWNG